MSSYLMMTFLKNSRELIQAKTYEPIVLQFMNQSKKIFPETYYNIKDQSHGEPDFISASGVKFDAKLLFSTEQCELLAKGEEYLLDWLKSVKQELSEASRMLRNKNFNEIQSTCLYKEIERRLPDKSVMENTIFFTPFPIVPTFDSIYGQFASDILSVIFDTLAENEPQKLANKSNYIIYPTSDGKQIVLRNLSRLLREYCSIDPLLEYVSHRLVTDPNLNADLIIFK